MTTSSAILAATATEKSQSEIEFNSDGIPMYSSLHYNLWRSLFVAKCKLKPHVSTVLNPKIKDPCTAFRDFYPDEFAIIEAAELAKQPEETKDEDGEPTSKAFRSTIKKMFPTEEQIISNPVDHLFDFVKQIMRQNYV